MARKGGGQGKGKRGQAAKADGTPNPDKHTRPDPNRPGWILVKDPHTGKTISKPAPNPTMMTVAAATVIVTAVVTEVKVSHAIHNATQSINDFIDKIVNLKAPPCTCTDPQWLDGKAIKLVILELNHLAVRRHG